MGCRHCTYLMILTLKFLKLSDFFEKVGGFIICVGLIVFNGMVCKFEIGK